MDGSGMARVPWVRHRDRGRWDAQSGGESPSLKDAEECGRRDKDGAIGWPRVRVVIASWD
eukprot:1157728-Pelagomonas_calceolata.AAC.4